jgi:outer membrane receptor protein involved in Fe transport
MRLGMPVFGVLSFSELVTTAVQGGERLEELSGSVGAGPSPSAQMPQGGPSAVGANSDGASVEEVVVTAQKREERLIDTPQSVSVLSAEALSSLSATQFSDYATTIAGLNYGSTGAGSTKLTLRGVSAGFDINPTVGIYIDEVPYGRQPASPSEGLNAIDVGSFGLERIEVLRGPQGTLYGASSMSGLFKYVTKQPDTDRFGVDAQAGLSSTWHGGISETFGSVINMPLISNEAAVRLSGFYTHEAGYFDNIAVPNGKDVNTADIYGGRIDFLLNPTDTLSIRIDGFLQDVSRGGESTADYSFAGSPLYGDLNQHRLLAEPFSSNFRLLSGTVDYDLSWASLTSITAYQTVRTYSVYDISAAFVPILGNFGGPYGAVGYPSWVSSDKVTEEVRLTSSGAGPLQWLGGGFYNKEISSRLQYFRTYDLTGNEAPNSPYDYFNIYIPTRFQEYAAFGDLTWFLTSKFDVTGGLRYARNNQSFTQDGSGLFVNTSPTTHATQSTVTYLANVRYHLSTHATAYLRYATGYRPGGPNALVTDAAGNLLAPPTFQPDRLKSYEGGFKGESSDSRFGIDLAVYYIDWNNIQILVGRGGFSIPGNAPGGATIKGGELTLTARPISGLTMSGVFAYQDGSISKADPDLGADAGERLPGVPRFTGALNADYLFADNAFEPTTGVTVRYQSNQTSSFNKSPTFPQYNLPAFTTMDLHATIKLGSVTAQLYLRNLFDERGQQSALNTSYGTARVAIERPRTIGLMATTKFWAQNRLFR